MSGKGGCAIIMSALILVGLWGFNVVSAIEPTRTLVDCSPNPSSAGSNVVCTAWVSGLHPDGFVTWSSSSSTGTFSTLNTYLTSGSSGGNTSTTFTDTNPGQVIITASYNGNSVNSPSTGSSSLTLNPAKLAGTDWSMFRSDPSHSGAGTGNPALTPTLLWKYNLGGTVSLSPAVANGIVYEGSDDGYVYALNKNDGAIIWKYNTGVTTTGSSVESSPAVVNGVVYVCSYDANIHALNGNVYALNAASGAYIWKYSLFHHFTSSITVSDNIVYVGADDGYIYALNASNGAYLWKYSAGEYTQVNSSPAVANGIVYVGSYMSRSDILGPHGYVTALNSANGVRLWQYVPGGLFYVTSSPAVVNGIVYIGSSDSIYALNAATGAYIWKYTTTTGGVFSSSPAVANGIVYVGSGDANVYALNAATGAYIWKYTTGGQISSSPAVVGGVVYVGSYDSNVYALNAASGSKIWSYTTGNRIYSSPAVVGGIVYIGSDDGYVYATGSSSTNLSVSISQSSPQISIGQTDTFNAIASEGLSPYTFEWLVNNQVQTGQTGDSYVFRPSLPGTYTIQVHVTDSKSPPTAAFSNQLYVIVSAQSSTIKSIGQGVAVNGQYVFCVYTSTNQVAMYDPTTGNVVGSSLSVGKNPVSLATFQPPPPYVSSYYSLLRNIVLCVNQGDDTVTIINSATSSPTVIGNPISVGKQPIGIATDTISGLALVTDFGSNQISILNFRQYPQITTYSIPLSDSPTGIAVNPYSPETLYVSLYNSHSIKIITNYINAQNYASQGTINVGAYPMGICLAGSDRLYVANSGSGTVNVIGLTTGTIPITTSSPVYTITLGGTPIGIVNTQASIYDSSTMFIMDKDSSNVACISDALYDNSAPLAISISTSTITNFAQLSATSIVMLNKQNQIIIENTVPLNFNVPSGIAGAFSLGGWLIGEPDIALPSTLYVPTSMAYPLVYTHPDGYTLQSLQTTGSITYDSSTKTLTVNGAGTITPIVQEIVNWAKDPAFIVNTQYINLATVGTVATSASLNPAIFLSYELLINQERLSQNPIQISVITASSSTTSTQFANQLKSYFQISPALNTNGFGDYAPGMVIILHIPFVQTLNSIYGISIPIQQYRLQFPEIVSSTLGTAKSIDTTLDGSLNMAFTISRNTNSYDQIGTALDKGSSVIAKLLKPNLVNVVEVVESILQGVLDSIDISTNIITSDLNQKGALSAYIFSDLYQTKTSVSTIITMTGMCQKWLSLGEYAASSAMYVGGDLLSDVRFVLTAVDIGFDAASTWTTIVGPNNDAFNAFVSCVDTVTNIVDPNGTTIIPSFYDSNGNLILGYNVTSGDIIFRSHSGLLLEASDLYYGYLFENQTSPISYEVVLNTVGSADVNVPYVLELYVSNSTVSPICYVGFLPTGNRVEITANPLPDGSIIQQTALAPKVKVNLTSSGYYFSAQPYLSNGTLYSATTGHLIINNTTYNMNELNISDFECLVPYSESNSNEALVYLFSPGIAGGYISVQLPSMYQVTFSQSVGGSINPTGSNVWENAGSISIMATPNNGYAFAHWSSDTGSITFNDANSAITTATINGPGTITSNFSPTPTSTPTPNPSSTSTTNPSHTPVPTPAHTSTPTSTPTLTPSASPSPTIPEVPAWIIISGILLITTLFAIKISTKRTCKGDTTQKPCEA